MRLTHEIDLEIVSVKSPASLPEIAKSGKFPGYPLFHRPFFANNFRELPIWVKTARLSLSLTRVDWSCGTTRAKIVLMSGKIL